MFAIIPGVARLLWTQKQDIGPSPRSNFGLAYDSVRKLTHLFGGSVDSTDTWSWDGRYWTQVSRFGPTRRTGHSMTFDTARSYTVLFGGEPVAGQALRDTWVFDGAEWTQVEDIGPSLRTEPATAFDQNRGRLVLFGGLLRGDGVDGQWARDTWEWDGATWTQVEDTGPAKRRSHCLAYDSDRKRTVLFGGLAELTDGSHQFVNDTWEWDGTSWTQVGDTGPAARADAAMTSTGSVVILHGGDSGTQLADTWQWASGAWSKVHELGPSPRRGHAMTYDTERKRIVLFGGEVETTTGGMPVVQRLGDTWEAPASSVAESPVATNVTVAPNPFSFSAGIGLIVEFEIPRQNETAHYGIYLGPQQSTPQPPTDVILLVSSIPAGVTRANALVDPARLAYVAQYLNVPLPGTAWVHTTLGDAAAQLMLMA